MNGVAVPEFFVGFGPKLVSFKKGDTEYSIRAIPFGGACRMAGPMDPDIDPEKRISSKKPVVKLAIYLAGPIFNLVLAFIVSLVVIGFVGYDPCRVMGVVENSSAEEAGLKSGDIITSFGDLEVNLGRELAVDLKYDPLDEKPRTITYIRNGEEHETVLNPRYHKTYRLGFTYNSDNSFAKVIQVAEDSAFEKAGIKVGDIIRKIGDYEVKSGADLYGYFQLNPVGEGPLSIEIERDGVRDTTTCFPQASEGYELGFSFNYSYREPVDAFDTIKYSFYELKYNIVGTMKSLVMLFTGKLGMDNVGGPVKIVEELNDTIDATKEEGVFIVIMNILNWIIVISANLGIMNLLPIPTLDGGRILFALIELIIRKPIPPEKENVVNIAGVVILFILVVFIFFKDIIMLFV